MTTAPDGTDTPASSAGDDERLAALRSELEAIGEVPVAERVAVFERANTTIARELAQLDEV